MLAAVICALGLAIGARTPLPLHRSPLQLRFTPAFLCDSSAEVKESPFQAGSTTSAAPPASTPGKKSGAAAAGELELTVANVDAVLDEVRPYLVADGGNVAVASVDTATRDVFLELQGACGSCPSSTVTMQMGIERVLREKFDNLGKIERVDDGTDSAGSSPSELTIEAATAALEPIMPAVRGLGGSLEVVSVSDGTVQLKYEGAEKIKYGIRLALQDNPLIEKVDFL